MHVEWHPLAGCLEGQLTRTQVAFAATPKPVVQAVQVSGSSAWGISQGFLSL